MACVRVCPADAVAVEGAIVRIVDDACTRCGLCLPACPHDAIEALGDVSRALELALAGRAALILSVECAAYFYPAAPNQVVNACYAAGFPPCTAACWATSWWRGSTWTSGPTATGA